MIWIICNIPTCTPIETFASALQTPVNLPGVLPDNETFSDPVPTTDEEWIQAQGQDPDEENGGEKGWEEGEEISGFGA